MKSVSKVILIITSILFLYSCVERRTEPAEKEADKDGVFIHVSHGTDDPHRVLMALSMAEKMSETKDVAIYFDIKGVEVVLKNAESLEYSHFTPSQEQLNKLIDKGIAIMVCPGCLKAADKTAEDLMEGIQVADKEKFFNFTKGRILSIDY